MKIETYLTVCSTILTLNFSWWIFLQRSAKEDVIKSAAKWLISPYSKEKLFQWRDHIVKNFDETFGVEPFSMIFAKKSLKVTALTSVAVWCVILFIGLHFSPYTLSQLLDLKDFDYLVKFSFVGLLGAFLYNLIPDFLSLCETRLVLSYIHKSESKRKIVGYLILDFILSTGVFVFWFSIWTVLILSGLHKLAQKYGFSDYLLASYFSGAMFGFISVYLSSGWIWIYGIASPISQVVNYLFKGKLTTVSNRILDIENKPFNYLAILSTLLLLLIELMIYVLFSHSIR